MKESNLNNVVDPNKKPNRKQKQLTIHDNRFGLDVGYILENGSWELIIGRKTRRLAIGKLEGLLDELQSLEVPPERFIDALDNKTFGLGRGEFLFMEDYYNALAEWRKKGKIFWSCE